MKQKNLLLQLLLSYYDKNLHYHSFKSDEHLDFPASLENSINVHKNYDDSTLPIKDRLAIFNTKNIPNTNLPSTTLDTISEYFDKIPYDNYIYYDDHDDSKELWTLIDNLLNNLVNLEDEFPEELDINILGLLINPSYKTLFITMIKDLVISNEQLEAYANKQDHFKELIDQKDFKALNADILYRLEQQHTIDDSDPTKRLKKALIFRICNLVYEKLDNILDKDDYKDLIQALLDLKTISLKEFIKQSNNKRQVNASLLSDTISEFTELNKYFTYKQIKPQVLESQNLILLTVFIYNYMQNISFTNLNYYPHPRMIQKNHLDLENSPTQNLISANVYENVERPHKIRAINQLFMQKLITNLNQELVKWDMSREYLYYFSKEIQNKAKYLRWYFIDFVNFNVLYNNMQIIEALKAYLSVGLPNNLNIQNIKRIFRYQKKYPKNIQTNNKHQHYKNQKLLYSNHVWFLNQDYKARNRRFAQTVSSLPKYTIQNNGLKESIPKNSDYLTFYYGRKYSYKRYLKNIARYCFTHPILFYFYKDLFKIPRISLLKLTEVTHLIYRDSYWSTNYFNNQKIHKNYQKYINYIKYNYTNIYQHFRGNKVPSNTSNQLINNTVFNNHKKVFIIGKEHLTKLRLLNNILNELYNTITVSNAYNLKIYSLKYFKYAMRQEENLVDLIKRYDQYMLLNQKEFNPYLTFLTLNNNNGYKLDQDINLLDINTNILNVNIKGLNYLNFIYKMYPLILNNIQNIKTLNNELLVITLDYNDSYEPNPHYLSNLLVAVDFMNDHSSEIQLLSPNNLLELTLPIDRDFIQDFIIERSIPLEYVINEYQKKPTSAIEYSIDFQNSNDLIEYKLKDTILDYKEPYAFNRKIVKSNDYRAILDINDNELEQELQNAKNNISINNINEYLDITPEDIKNADPFQNDTDGILPLFNINYYGKVLDNNYVNNYKKSTIIKNDSYLLFNINNIKNKLYCQIFTKHFYKINRFTLDAFINAINYMFQYNINTMYIPYLNKLYLPLILDHRDKFYNQEIICDSDNVLEFLRIKLDVNSPSINIKDVFYLTKLDNNQKLTTIKTQEDLSLESYKYYNYLEMLNNNLNNQQNNNQNINKNELVLNNLTTNITLDSETNHINLWNNIDYGNPDMVFHHRLLSVYEYSIKDINKTLLSFKYPTGKPTILMGDNLPLNQLFGLVYAKVSIPNLFKPQLPYKYLDHITYPTGIIEGWYFSEELKTLKQLDYTITITKALHYKSTKLFNNLNKPLFIEILSNQINNPTEYININKNQIKLNNIKLDNSHQIDNQLNHPIFKLTYKTYNRMLLFKELNRFKNKGQVSAILNNKQYLTSPVPLKSQTCLNLEKIHLEMNIYNENLYQSITLNNKEQETNKLTTILNYLYGVIKHDKDRFTNFTPNYRLSTSEQVRDLQTDYDLMLYIVLYAYYKNIQDKLLINQDVKARQFKQAEEAAEKLRRKIEEKLKQGVKDEEYYEQINEVPVPRFYTPEEYKTLHHWQVKDMLRMSLKEPIIENNYKQIINTFNLLSRFKFDFSDPNFFEEITKINVFNMPLVQEWIELYDNTSLKLEKNIIDNYKTTLNYEYYINNQLSNIAMIEPNSEYYYKNQETQIENNHNANNYTIMKPLDDTKNFKDYRKNKQDLNKLDLQDLFLTGKTLYKDFNPKNYMDNNFKNILDNSIITNKIGYNLETYYNEKLNKIIIKKENIEATQLKTKQSNTFNIKNIRQYSYPFKLINNKYKSLIYNKEGESVQDLYTIKTQSNLGSIIIKQLKKEIESKLTKSDLIELLNKQEIDLHKNANKEVDRKINLLVKKKDQNNPKSEEERILINKDTLSHIKEDVRYSDLQDLLKREDNKDLNNKFYNAYLSYIQGKSDEKLEAKELDSIIKRLENKKEISLKVLKDQSYNTRFKQKTGRGL